MLLFRFQNQLNITQKLSMILLSETPNRSLAQRRQVLLENLEFLNEKAFGTDKELFSELFDHKDNQGQRLGIVLIANNTICKSC